MDVVESATSACLDYFARFITPLRTAIDHVAFRVVLPASSGRVDLLSARAALYIALAPAIWNALARTEYYTGALSRACLGYRRVACVLLALWIFLFSLYRDAVVVEAVRARPMPVALLERRATEAAALGYALGAVGLLFVLTSFVRLGFFGTYLGDYFGILMEAKVTGFPFSAVEHPMYDGSTLMFLGKALMERSGLGLVLALWVFAVYRIACLFEGPFTAMIYARAAKRQAGRRARESAAATVTVTARKTKKMHAANGSGADTRVRRKVH